MMTENKYEVPPHSEIEKDQRLKQVAQALEITARNAVKRYEEECDSFFPQARLKLETTIKPWLEEYFHSQDYDVRKHTNIAFSDPIEYFYPCLALSLLSPGATENGNPFLNVAKTFNYYERYGLSESRQTHEAVIAAAFPWRAWFGIDQNDPGVIPVAESRFPVQNDEYVIYLAYGPTKYRGFAWRGGKKDYLVIPFNARRSERLLDVVHPLVFVGFAEQIENGRVQQKVNENL